MIVKNKKLLILVLIAVLVGFGIFKIGNIVQKDIDELSKIIEVQSESSPVESAQLIIDKDNLIEKKVKIKPNGTVFDLLQNSEVRFDYEEYDSGIFITSIEGISNPTQSWLYYVNEKLGKKAVDKKKINSGDVVKFKNQKSPF